MTCHNPNAPDKSAARFNLTATKAWESLVTYGKPSLFDHVRAAYRQGRSIPNAGAAKTSPLLQLLESNPGHRGVHLDPEAHDRLVTWLDTYGQLLGSYSPEQEERLRQFRTKMAEVIE